MERTCSLLRDIHITGRGCYEYKPGMGTTVTPLPKSKPWIVARQTVALDHLSNGRLTIGVGLGAEESTDYDRFGKVADNRVLGEKLDEALSIIAGLWTGKPFSHNGKHFRVKKTVFLPSPLQKPRIPIWVGGDSGLARVHSDARPNGTGQFPENTRRPS